MNEIGYCAENEKIYIPEYGEKIWEIDGVNGELKLIIKDLMIGDHRNGGITCKDGYLYFALGLPSNTGFADPDNHGWTDMPNDPFWVKHDDGHGTTPHDPVCRDIVHTGLNVQSPRRPHDRRPVAGRRACQARHGHQGAGAVRRLGDARQDDGQRRRRHLPAREDGGLRHRLPQPGGRSVRPEGHKWENALAVSDNGANDLGHRRIANGAEKLFIVTEKGQDAGFPDKEGFGFVTNKRSAGSLQWRLQVDRPHPQLYIGDKPFVPKMPPYMFQAHLTGVRGVPLIAANPNPTATSIVLDCRFLPNPYWVDSLRPLTGQDPAVVAHVLGEDAAQQFLDRLDDAPRRPAARVRVRGQGVPEHRVRLHRRPPPLRGHRRGGGQPPPPAGDRGHRQAPRHRPLTGPTALSGADRP